MRLYSKTLLNMKKYYPILLSKKGEIVALQYLTQVTKDGICPVVEVVDDSLEKLEKKDSPKKVYKDELENFLKTHWSFFENQIILDFSLVTDIDTKLGIIEKMIISLLKAGVNVIPALQMNSASKFGALIKSLLKKYSLKVCWRTSENSGGYDNFKIGVDKFIPYIGVDPARIIILLDLGYAKHDRYNSLRDIANAAIKSLSQKVDKWLAVVVASSSFPENLGEFKSRKQPYVIDRNEWKIWKSLISDKELTAVKYGDFGTKYPFYVDANFAGTISVKYTTEYSFVVYKGELTNEHKDGHGQYITHAAELIKSEYYSGEDFSWGDMRIKEVAEQDIKSDKRKTGSSTTWVQISQNHHIALLYSLL